jgi:hypothetical protein
VDLDVSEQGSSFNSQVRWLVAGALITQSNRPTAKAGAKDILNFTFMSRLSVSFAIGLDSFQRGVASSVGGGFASELAFHFPETFIFDPASPAFCLMFELPVVPRGLVPYRCRTIVWWFIAAQFGSKFRFCIGNVLLLMGFRTGRRTRVLVNYYGHVITVPIALPCTVGCALWRKSRGIIEGFGIVQHVNIGIDAGFYSQRVALNVFANRRVIVSEVVVMQSRLPIEELSGEAQIVGKRSSRRALSYPAAILPVRSRS